MELNYILTFIKKEYEWLKKADSTALQMTSRRFREAMNATFSKRNKPPKFKKKKYVKRSYTGNSKAIIIDDKHIQLPKAGIIRTSKQLQFVDGNIKEYTISKSKSGKWFLSLTFEVKNQDVELTDKAVGLDLGISTFAMSQTGETFQMPHFSRHKIKELQVKVDRRRKRALKENRNLETAKNYQKARRQLASEYEHVSNQVIDFVHKLVHHLFKSYDTIILEDLSIQKMIKGSKQRGLNREISYRAWGKFITYTQQKTTMLNGKQAILVSPYKTSQMCSNCGHDDGKHELWVRDWVCPMCHIHHDRDINAAQNIYNKGICKLEKQK